MGLFALAAVIFFGAWQERHYAPPGAMRLNLPHGAILLAPKDSVGRKLPADLGGYSLLVLPPCQTCSLKHLDAASLKAHGLEKTIVLLQSKRSEMPVRLSSTLKGATYIFEEPWPKGVPRELERYAPAFYRLDDRSEVDRVEQL